MPDYSTFARIKENNVQWYSSAWVYNLTNNAEILLQALQRNWSTSARVHRCTHMSVHERTCIYIIN
jgi:hypothetical protein